MDTVKLSLSNRGAKQLPHCLSKAKDTYTQYGEHYITGYADNMHIKIKDDKITVVGSLCKYLHSNNFENMTRLDTQYALEKLQDKMGMLLGQSNVYRIDVGYCLEMDKPVENYLGLLDYAPNYKKLVQPKSIYFANGQRQLLLYDKLEESKSKGIAIPSQWQGKHLLRPELRYLHRIKDQFKKVITAKHLYDPTFFAQLTEQWKANFNNIRKVKSLAPIQNNMTPDQFKDYLLADYIQQNGMDNILKKVDNHKDSITNKKAVQRIKDSIKNSKHLIIENPLIAELDYKINDVGYKD